jgi:hypothetical protein
MKTIALWTALIMATSTAAFAAPPRVVQRDDAPRTSDRDRDHDRDHDGNIVRDHYDRYDHSRWSREFHGRWVPITRGTTRAGRTDFFLPTKQRYRKIRIEGTRGQSVIGQVAIEFGDGTTQVVNLNAPLPPGAGEVIDLTSDVRTVKRIIVDADQHSRGQFTVYGA